MSAALVDAVVARIKAGADGLGVTAYDGQPSSPTYPYCIVYASAGIGSSDVEGAALSRRDLDWQTVVVGKSAAQARAAVDRVAAALEAWRPVAGASRVVHEGSQPVRVDESMADRSLFIATDQWRVVSSLGA